MPYTAPNQKVITIHRAPLSNSFLGINNDNWKYAARVLGAQAFLLYIYLASNKDDYKYALSPAAVQQEIGMPRSTYYDQLRKLESLGFLVPDKKKMLHFYEAPQSDTHIQNARMPLNSTEDKSTGDEQKGPSPVQNRPQENIEIYINKKIKTNIPGEQKPSEVESIRRKPEEKFHF